MNKKQRLLNIVKNLNLTQSQQNELVNILSSGLGNGGEDKDKVFKLEVSGTDAITIKINDTDINFTMGNEGGYGEVCYIDENTFNFIKDVMIDATIFEVVATYGTARMKALVLYKEFADEFDCGLYVHFNYDTEISRFFSLSKNGSKYLFTATL